MPVKPVVRENGAAVVGHIAVYDSVDGTVIKDGGAIPSATPAGTDTEIQFNNTGIFGASSQFKWDETDKTLYIGPPEASLPAVIQGYTGPVRTLITSLTGNVIGIEAVSSEGIIIALVGPGGAPVTGVDAEIYAGADGDFVNVLYSVGYSNGFAVDTLRGLVVDKMQGTDGGGTAVNCVGIDIIDQNQGTVGNWALRTHLGLVEFGDIVKFAGSNSTGAGLAVLTANCPAVTPASPYTWIKAKSADGSTVYIPCWK